MLVLLTSILPAIIGAGAMIGGGLIGAGIASKNANKDRWEAEKQHGESMDFAREQFEYSKQQDERAYYESLPQTKVQRMLEAGLHPTLAAGNTGQSGQGHAPLSGTQPGPTKMQARLDALAIGAQIGQILANVRKMDAETRNIEADTDRTEVMTDYTREAAGLARLHQAEIVRRLNHGDLSHDHLNTVIRQMKTGIDNKIAETGKIEAQTTEIRDTLKLEIARMDYNLQKLRASGLHEKQLSTMYGQIEHAARILAEGIPIKMKEALDVLTTTTANIGKEALSNAVSNAPIIGHILRAREKYGAPDRENSFRRNIGRPGRGTRSGRTRGRVFGGSY